MTASLYIHIPFCASLCDYCDFYSINKNTVGNEFIDSYLKAVVCDIKYQIEYFNVKEIPTVYIGGGTPSVLGEKIKVLFDSLNVIPGFSPAEFTVEVNPESVTERFLEVCREGGVNRLSIGVQSFHEKSRAAVGRGKNESLSAQIPSGFVRENPRTIIKDKINLASRYFPGSLSIDLITGLPFQDEKIVIDDIKRVLEFNPAHVSLYGLSLEKGTVLEEKIRKKDVVLPSEDFAELLWLKGRDLLLKEGFEHYEISNFAKPGKYSLHNMRYWQMKNWIGVGSSASGTIVNEDNGTAKRYTYSKDINEYIKGPNIQNAVCEELDKITLIKDCLLMGYRCNRGPDLQLFKSRFGCSIENYIKQTLEKWKDRDKMLFLNQFLKEAFKELI